MSVSTADTVERTVQGSIPREFHDFSKKKMDLGCRGSCSACCRRVKSYSWFLVLRAMPDSTVRAVDTSVDRRFRGELHKFSL